MTDTKKIHAGNPAITAFLLLVTAILIFPLLIIAIVSISDNLELAKNLFSFVHKLRLDNYVDAFERGRIAHYFMNTVIVVVITVVVTIMSASLCAFGIRRFKFREVQAVYYIVISGLFVPIQAVILPVFRLLKTIGLINTLPGLALVYIGVNIPLTLILFTGFYKSIPLELEEAATIDGCSAIGAYWKIIFPLSKTIISTLIILVGLNIWKDFFIPLVVITTPLNKTLAIGLLAFVNEFSLDWTHLCAAMVMQTIPIVILFLGLQKYFVSGVVSGAVKG